MSELGIVRKSFYMLRNFFAVFGILCFFGGVLFCYQRGITPRFIVKKVTMKFRLADKKKSNTPQIKFRNHSFSGKIKKERPRLIIGGGEQLQKIRNRYAVDPNFKKMVDATSKVNNPRWKAVAWACGKKYKDGEYVVENLLKSRVSAPTEGGSGNAHDVALLYDLVYDHPNWTIDKRHRLGILLRQSLVKTLRLLDSESPSLWHGRFQMACIGWIIAAAMDHDGTERDVNLLSRAQAHFIEALSAIAKTEGWPGGYSYWINNRAFPFLVASFAHINTVTSPDINRNVRRMIERIGLWTIYGTEPNGRFSLFGDTGPRNDLKDETQRVIDAIAVGTGLYIFNVYSDYLYGLYGNDGYNWSYRWSIPLVRGLSDRKNVQNTKIKSLSAFDGFLKTSEVFGRNGLGQVFIRSNWGQDATFISYQAGNIFAHHGHYNAGHFTISKKEPLAISSGTYGGYTSAHRLNYYIRTVASNSILVLRPGEVVKPNKFFVNNVSDGGQRVVMPTGSVIDSLDRWQANLYKGRHYEGGKIEAFDNLSKKYVYVSSDLTGAYNSTAYDDNAKGGKVSKITRQLLYLSDEDILITYDQVEAVNGGFTKKWLLHSWEKPKSRNEKILIGKSHDGILETTDVGLTIENGAGQLKIKKILPKDGVVRKVGGPNYRYYVEVDGDDSDLDGKNMVEGANEKPWYDAGLWRIEIQPKTGRKFDEFLVLLKPGIKGQQDSFLHTEILTDMVAGIQSDTSVVIFPRKSISSGKIAYFFSGKGQTNHIILNVPANDVAAIQINGKKMTARTSSERTLTFETGSGVRGNVIITFRQ